MNRPLSESEAKYYDALHQRVIEDMHRGDHDVIRRLPRIGRMDLHKMSQPIAMFVDYLRRCENPYIVLDNVLIEYQATLEELYAYREKEAKEEWARVNPFYKDRIQFTAGKRNKKDNG